ncbi:DinB family protein [Belliella pelovolcani]|uniref:DinB family protein n=1 Tax=Belliella pelovolcani TaxID=529505 RepID=UPI00391929FF
MNESMKPKVGEYAPYYGKYIDKIINEDISKLLLNQVEEIRKFYEEMGEEKSNQAYAEGKWTAKEVLNHIADTDRVMTFRALCFSRGETSPLPGFDQDIYVSNARANDIPLMNLLEDFEMQRYALVSMLKTLPIASYTKTGIASNHEVSVRALFYIMAGHVFHHLEVLKERY